MNDEKEKELQEEQPENDYIKAINELKENSVPKEEFLKLKEENKQLIDSLVKGGAMEKNEDEPPIDVAAISKKLAERDPRISTLEGVKMILDLRKADIKEGKRDPFISINNHSPSEEDFQKAEARAKIYQECIDYAAGDPNLFSQELTRRMVDNFHPRKK